MEGADVILIALYWPRCSWFADLRGLSKTPPWRIPTDRISLRQGAVYHPDPQVAPASRLELKRKILRQDCFPAEVITTILASCRQSTTRIYEATWAAFRHWCSKNSFIPTVATVPQVLGFLQEGLNSGLAINTFHRQVSALTIVVRCKGVPSLSRDPYVRSFLRGAANLHPPTVQKYPSWDLSIVLRALTEPPFEPLTSASLKFLTFKISFLVAITSARRVSKLAALPSTMTCMLSTPTVSS